jgi:hypothetical protein
MSWRYAIVKKIKDWKIDGRMLSFIENFMKERTLRVTWETRFRTRPPSKTESFRERY